MDRGNAPVKVFVSAAASALLMSAIAGAQSPGTVNGQDVGFIETDLVTNVSPLTDSNGIVHIPLPCTAVTNPPPCVDANLLNPWGLVGSTPTPVPPATNSPSPWWISDNGSNKSTVYADDVVAHTFTISSTVVNIPCPSNPTGTCGTPTGIVWNTIQASTTSFLVSGNPAKFIWATEDGTIVAWFSGATGVIVKPDSGMGDVYKGMEIATNSGTTLLYVTNFSAGTVDMYDTLWTKVVSPGAFKDPKLPPGYSPFNIVLVGNRLIVTYAVRDSATNDDVKGPGLGIVNSFDLTGHGLKRLVTGIATGDRSCRNPSTLVKCKLNAPWGVALAPQSFGKLANALLIGNFGDGRINGFNATTGAFIGTMHYGQSTPGFQGKPVVIDGLWALKVGNDQNGKSGYANTLYFTAGPNDEADGLFGALRPDGLYGTPPYPFPGP